MFGLAVKRRWKMMEAQVTGVKQMIFWYALPVAGIAVEVLMIAQFGP